MSLNVFDFKPSLRLYVQYRGHHLTINSVETNILSVYVPETQETPTAGVKWPQGEPGRL